MIGEELDASRRTSILAKAHFAVSGGEEEEPDEERVVLPPVPRIDLNSIQEWRKACHDTHGDCCNDRYSEALALRLDHLILVDVVNRSLVKLPNTTPISFIALSYVWGEVDTCKTLTSNFEQLQQPGAICSTNTEITIPNTIRDAMYLVAALGERYLWVDCLCVIQDAPSHEMDRTLRAMAHIYASAEFTIVATGSDANYGLRGIGGPSQDRPLYTTSTDLRFYGGYPLESRWVTRGWTFQESLFSRRLLCFDRRVSWLCGRYDWREGVIKAYSFPGNSCFDVERPHLGAPMGMMSLLPSIPSLGRWGMIVENFTSREFRYDRDALNAFAGATEVMGPTFPEGLLHGMPCFFFDIVLLWQPKGSIVRRHGEPSWSWTGWKGAVECLHPWYPFYAGLFRATGKSSDWLAVAPLMQLAKFNTVSIDGTVPKGSTDFNGFYQYQALREIGNEQDLPKGWERGFHRDGIYFTSESSTSQIPYAFPLPTVDPTRHQDHLQQSRVLSCTAPRVKLLFGEESKDENDMHLLASLRVHDTNVGYLTLHSPEQKATCMTGTSCELIILSSFVISDPKQVTKFAWPLCSHHNPCLGFKNKLFQDVYENADAGLNVMWIEWVRDVAERRAIGVVRADALEALEPESIMFKLG
ncbi:heterokaryon incompatibility protein [Pyrenophora tritici-repentis]|uniref:HET domain containing protein n=2 Tax=Pyrenophora tritici-repentis TaxID=45151 RepID=A0A2W1G4P8_9PLEO|nr:uncharacterized protein PTRG_05572 [Pyrenophora tritici-repentis Pt-1C-BFP]KAA8618639.1 heterokaryon incompatibility protein [Pyrenophora tritici-repentis]EDU48492.1 conserved hypothetical protein [Pyrenophora tritici-repentis Pt-1C-BFP]KAF7449112.1 heterokaryon incompatibility protein [Pyrenophora tritici-repentis]KAF7570884.1 HET domain containing protein [Pyrenophora tritici-repentis]KAG9383947.1 heterokaryon incompatibility protein [Pyrenophora tritici-repentis]